MRQLYTDNWHGFDSLFAMASLLRGAESGVKH